AVGRKLGDPELFASLRVKRTEALIDSRTNEDQTTRGRDASTDVADAALEADVAKFRQLLVDTERDAPGNFTRVCIDGNKTAIWRRDTRHRLTARQFVGEGAGTASAATTAAPSATAAPAGRRWRCILARVSQTESTGDGCTGRVVVARAGHVQEHIAELRVIRERSPCTDWRAKRD